MAGSAARTTIDRSDGRRGRIRRQARLARSHAPAASDRLARKRTAPRSGVRQHPRPDAEIVYGGRVDEEVARPHPSQTRMCRFPASGSSWESLARGGVDDTIRDSPAKKISKVSPRFHSCQLSYPLSFRGQVCEAQGPLPCFPSTALSTWHPAFLDRVPVSPVPQCRRYY